MSAKLNGMVDVLGFVDRTIVGVEDLPAGESHWTNGEVLELLGMIAAGLRNPEWAQVSIEAVLAERDALKRARHADLVNASVAALLYETSIGVLQGQVEQARRIAVRLEQELAEVSR